MGGRGAHIDRNEDGSLKVKDWKTVETVVVNINNKPVTVKILERKDPRKAMGLPSYSNSPNSIYAMRNPLTGKIERIRLYDKDCKGDLDLEYHGTLFHPNPFYHKHKINFEAKQGHEGEHLPFSAEDVANYEELIELLDT